MRTTLYGPKSRYNWIPSSLFEAVRTEYPSFFRHLFRNSDRDASSSTSKADFGEPLIALVGGRDGSGLPWGGLGGVLSMKESKYPILFSGLRNF